MRRWQGRQSELETERWHKNFSTPGVKADKARVNSLLWSSEVKEGESTNTRLSPSVTLAQDETTEERGQVAITTWTMPVVE